MPCLQWTFGGGSLAVPQLQARRIRRPQVGFARAGWGGKMEWNGIENGKRSKSVEGDSVKAAASLSSGGDDTDAFCIIEGRDTVMDFAQMDLQEIRDHISRRRSKIFLLMEEVRRLRIQQKIKSTEKGLEDIAENEDVPEFTSAIPLLAPMTEATLQQYFRTCLIIVAGIVLFGGLLAPVLELKLGLGGTSYKDFIQNMHLPMQLSEVDPIVASFSGGAVGVISSLMVVELNNVKRQEKQRCRYCHGTGYLACARCAGSGSIVLMENGAPTSYDRCPNCAGATKVMCPTCLCTGMALASEHDPRIDPFQLTSLLEVRPMK